MDENTPSVNETPQPYTVTIKNPINEHYTDEEVAENDIQGLPLLANTFQDVVTLLDQDNEKSQRVSDATDFLKELNRDGRYVALTREQEDYYARQFSNAMSTAAANSVQREPGREGANWHQSLLADGRELQTAIPVPKMGTTAASRSAYYADITGTGTKLNVMLPHSGIWVRLKSPTNMEIADFQYRSSEEKINLAVTNKGFAMSSEGYLAYDMIVDFALDHVTDSNVSFRTPTDLKSRISILDRNLLIWGLASVIYPDKVDFAIVCPHNDCDHVQEDKLSLRRMNMFDRTGITNDQLKHLNNGFKTATPAVLDSYTDMGTVGRPFQVRLSDRLGIEIAPSTLHDYAHNCQKWLQGLIAHTQDAINEPPEGYRRQALMERYAVMSRATQYRHWVRAIICYSEDGGEEPFIDRDEESIDNTLASVISSDKFCDIFVEAIDKYIRDNTIGIVAVPEFECPKCGKKHEEPEQKMTRFQRLIEIDCASYFFTLINVKLLHMAE